MRDRLVIVQHVYHQQQGQEPFAASTSWLRWLHGGEQVYVRKLTVGPDWTALDAGWLDAKIGLLLITNDEKPPANPTGETLVIAHPSRIVEIGLGERQCQWIIPPGEDLRGFPESSSAISLRCREGSARVTVTLFPR